MNENDVLMNDHQTLSQLLDRQNDLESKFSEDSGNQLDEKIDECVPPQVCHEFQTARLFLSHFGFLNLEHKETNEDSTTGGLIALDSTLPGFCSDLENLDRISPRTCDTVHIFYVKAGQKNPEVILSNVV